MLVVMAQFRTSRVFDAFFLITMAGVVWWAAANRVQIGDWVFFLHYQPNQDIITISHDAGLNPSGQKLLYRGDPQFDDRSTITQLCGADDIGCLTPAGQIYVLDEQGRHDRSIVTTAHEMLHLAYRRLSPQAKADLKPLLDQAIQMNAGPDLTSELSSTGDSDDRYDEAHSVLGSEYQHLPADLEKYYQRYFSDRAKDVAAEAHDATFDN
jgi:hypothetical protein